MQVGVWDDLGPAPLAHQEYLFIGIAGMVSSALLNREGRARSRGIPSDANVPETT